MPKIILFAYLIGTGLLFTPSTSSAQKNQILQHRVVEDGGTGPYSAIMAAENNLITHTVFRPKNLDAFKGKNKLPIMVWGNGACANSPWEHVNFLSEISSYGFLVVATGPMPKEGETGNGKSTSSQLIDAIDWAIAQNKDRKSVYYNKIDVAKIAVSGMSCGGLQTLEVAVDPRISTLMVCNSGIFKTSGNGISNMPNLTKESLKKIHSPTLYLLGGPKDIAYNNGMDDYEQINHVPVFVANMDVGHGGTYRQNHGGEFAKIATQWLLWQLKENIKASKTFTGTAPELTNNPNWTFSKKNIL